MPITGTWLDSVAYESGAEKWGHGINPVHYVGGAGYGGRSVKDPHTSTGPNAGQGGEVDERIIDPTDPLAGYTDEDFASMTWGYGPETSTSVHPPLGSSTEQFRGVATDNYPAPGYHEGGRPGGSFIRAIPIGGRQPYGGMKQSPKEETVGEGWVNKEVGAVEDAIISDPSQYEMQTSMIQRDKVRTGSQNPNTGTANEQTAPIGSFRPTWGQRIKPWSGGRRHWDMQPREQNEYIRPFWYRNAATGYREWLGVNDAYQYQREPLQRQPVPDPYAGVEVPSPGNVYQEESYPVQDYVNVWY